MTAPRHAAGSVGKDASRPLVTCVMPTRNGRRFVRLAVSRFLAQDYPAKELIVLDAGAEEASDLVPRAAGVRYVRLRGPQPLGAVRNLACELAGGDLIAHLDDDDWSSPRRLTVQVAALVGSGSDLCAVGGVTRWRPATAEAWAVACEASEPARLAGGTLLYRRDAWRARRFPASLPAPSRRFVAGFPADAVTVVDDPSLVVAVLHSGNATPDNPSDRRWSPVPVGDVEAMLGPAAAAYARSCAAPVPPSAPAGDRGLVLAAPFLVYDGYGSMAEYLALGLARAGAAVHPVALRIDQAGLSGEFLEMLRRARPERCGTVLSFMSGTGVPGFTAASNRFVNTMWETSRLPAGWADGLNQARAVIVPSRFVADAFRRSGVTAPVEVVAQGVDPAVYAYEARPPRPGVTTLMVGPVCARKNTAAGIAAWKRAFAGDAGARLLLKARWGYRNYVPDDPRIAIVDDEEPTRGIAHWYCRADVVMALGNEGFGLPLVEAMACGLPVIALDAEGQGDVCAEARDLVLRVPPSRFEPLDQDPYSACGVRAVPDVRRVADRLSWVARHPAEAAALGAAASVWALEHRNVWRMGPAVLDVIERRSRPPRRLRHGRLLWAPDWGRPAGLAGYVRRLADAAPGLEVRPDPPDIGAARLLHVQHAPGLVGAAELEAVADRARSARVPVVVTEHRVGERLESSELVADVLVALTGRDAAVLRGRWPDRHVEHIPRGCPTWFPARRPRHGRVVAVWGSLAEEGPWRVLDALPALRRAELFVVAARSTRALERRWALAAAGLRARLVPEPPARADAAALIAAEADVLVYWGRRRRPLATPDLVREGLATGVPVLAQPAPSIADLAAVTQQPTDLVEGLRALLDDRAMGARLAGAAFARCFDDSWHHVAERHLALWRMAEGA